MRRRSPVILAVAGGLALFATGVQGLVSVDRTLAGAVEPIRFEQKFVGDRDHDCPFKQRRETVAPAEPEV